MTTATISRLMFVSAFGGLLLGAQSTRADSSMPPGAFLHQPAPDITALNRQIQKDPLVAKRYARLYNMSPDMVRSAFSKMRLSTLTEDHVYQVHYVHPGEIIGYKVRRIRKGTAIYRLPDGTPALVRVCGNPIRAKQPKAVKGAHIVAPELGQTESALDFQPYEPLEATMMPSPEPSFGPRVGEPYTGFTESPDVAAEIPLVPVLAPAVSAVHAVSSFANAVPILGALGALGGLGALASGSGGNGSGGVPIIPGGGSGTPPGNGGGPVVTPPAAPSTPEPNSVFLALALISSGGVSLIQRRRKSKRLTSP